MSIVVRAVLVMLLCVMWAGISAGARPTFAAADPEPVVTDPGATPPIPWTQLGKSGRLDIVGSDQVADTDIVVPQGVTPGQLQGIIGSVVNVIGGRVDVLDGRGIVLGSIPVPADQSTVPFTVDMSAAQVIAGVARLSFVLREQTPQQDTCTPPPSLTLSQLASTYLGQTPYPVNVADFQPGYVDRFIIRTGPTPSVAQQQAVLDLVARLTQLYRPMPVGVDVDTSPDPAPPGPPTQRVIEVRDSAPAGLNVESPDSPDARLVISGRGDQLRQQVELFADRRIKLAQTPSATVRTATADAPEATTVKTFGQLGMTAQISVLGAATMYVGVDISRFAAGSVQDAKVHLIAHYSPVIGGEASVVIRSGSTVLAARRLDESGLLDITGTIPAASIESTVGIAVELRYLPNQQCAPLNNRLQFSLDPASTIAVTAGSHNRGGFPALPMAFTPDFDVAVDQPDHLRFAAEAINLLAQQTAATLRPRVATMSAGAASGRGLLVVARGEDLARAGLTPPVLPGKGTATGIGGNPDTDVDLGGPVGVVEAFSQQGRMVLAVTGTDDWSLVERSFDYIRALPTRWGSLPGDVVATGPAGDSVNLTLREGGALANDYPGDGWKWWAWLTGAAALLGLICTGYVLVSQRRHRSRLGRHVDRAA